MLTTKPMQGQVRCCQIWGRQRKREENHMSGSKCLFSQYKCIAELYPMTSILIQIIFFSISISSPAVWITKINECISETFFF